MFGQTLAPAHAIGTVDAALRRSATHGPFMCRGYGSPPDATEG